MNVVDYIKQNWDSLPKSSFNDIDVVIFETVENYDGGWGHHGYEGYGVDAEGNVVVATSSGCSCNGGCDVSSASLVSVEKFEDEFGNFNAELVNFSAQQVSFSDY